MIVELFLPWWCNPEAMKYLTERPCDRRRFFCRMCGHRDWHGKRYGVAFYNLTGLEPDMHCNNCGDDLG